MKPFVPLHLLFFAVLASTAFAAEEASVPLPATAFPRIALSAPEPHPSRAHRLVVKTEAGLTIEYAPGMEADVQAAADRATARNAELAASLARETAMPSPSSLPLSALHLHEHREEILRRIAAEIGLPGPTDLQRACYDTFLSYYESMSDIQETGAVLLKKLAEFRRIEIWEKADMVARFEAGEAIENFSYDPTTKRINFALNLEYQGNPGPEETAELEKIKQQTLDHAFNYEVKDGIATFSARFSLPRGKTPTPVARPNRVPVSVRLEQQMKDFSWSIPLMRTKENATQTSEEFVAESFGNGASMARPRGNNRPYRDGSLALVVLHETIEAGIVERYIGSRDRRWLCDGAANYLAWKIARDLDRDFAREVYDLDRQLARYAPVQSKIDLRKWPAVEYQRETERDTDVTRAHYAFATRAVKMMAEQHGDDFIPELFREIARTPRKKVTMKTVANAYAKITGRKLATLLVTAQRAPLPLPTDQGSLTPATHPSSTNGN